MKAALIFDPDPAIGPDPLDTTAKLDRSVGEWLDSDTGDLLIVFRRYGDEFEGGSRTNVVGGGAWEYLTGRQVGDILDRLGDVE